MRHFKYIIIAAILLLPYYGAAQTEDTGEIAELAVEDFMEVKIPPLDVLLENARESPNVKYLEEYAVQQKRELKTVKRTWLKYIKLNAGYQYGNTVAYNYNNTGGDNTGDIDTPIFIGGGMTSRSYYNVGASLSLPLDEIFNKRNKIKQQQSVIEGAQYEADRNFNQLALQIVDAYTMAMENLAILRSKAEAAELSSAQYKVTEQDFINGRIDAQTLSRQKNIESVNIREYETTRSSLLNAILRLEILSGTRIINK